MADQATFFLRVIASDKKFYHDQAEALVVQTVDGQQEFLAHHSQAILAISPGELRIRTRDGEWIDVVVGYGSMVFANNRATVLVDTCETEEELDARRAEEALERAKERLRQQQSQREYHMTQAAMARALSRLKFKGKEMH